MVLDFIRLIAPVIHDIAEAIKALAPVIVVIIPLFQEYTGRKRRKRKQLRTSRKR